MYNDRRQPADRDSALLTGSCALIVEAAAISSLCRMSPYTPLTLYCVRGSELPARCAFKQPYMNESRFKAAGKLEIYFRHQSAIDKSPPFEWNKKNEAPTIHSGTSRLGIYFRSTITRNRVRAD